VDQIATKRRGSIEHQVTTANPLHDPAKRRRT
jgi:hypothetical protein